MKLFARACILSAVCLCCTLRAESQWVSHLAGGNSTSLLVTSDAVFAGMAGSGIFRSTDHGVTWQSVSAGLPSLTIRALAASGDRVYAGSDSGVFVSADNGGLWSSINLGLSDRRVYSLATKDSLVFAGTMNGVYRSTDNGEHWARVALPPGFATLIYSLAIRGSTIIAGTASYHSMVFRSTDDGLTWNTTSALGSVWSLVVMGTRVIAGTNDGVRISQDDGATWARSASDPPNRIVRSLFVHQSSLLAGTQGGVYVSTDSAASWMSLNSGLADTVVTALTVDGQTLMCGATSGIWTRALTSFSMVPAAPMLHAPADHAVDQPRSIELRWSRPDLATSFHVQVNTDSTFLSGVVIDTPGYTDSAFPLVGLKVGQRYFWRVVAANVYGSGLPSAVWSFATVASAPPSPELIEPAANGWVYPGGNRVSWHPATGARSYRYQIARDSSFTSLEVDSTIADTSGITRLSTLGLHYWRVQAINDAGPGPFSGVRVFAAAYHPQLASPWYGASHVSLWTSLSWHRVPEATGYRITVALGSEWNNATIVFNALVSDTSCKIEDLQENRSYVWQVHARYDSGKGFEDFSGYVEGPPSAIWLFDTRTDAATDLFPLKPHTFHLYEYSRSYYHEFDGKEWASDSGNVVYTVKDRIYLNDSTALWNLSEGVSVLHRHWAVDQSGILLYDSSSWRSWSSTVTMTEALTREHELLCESLVWHFPRLPDSQSVLDWSGRPPVYRFSRDTSQSVTQYRALPDTGQYQVLRFSAGRGLTDRWYFSRREENGITTVQEVGHLLSSGYLTDVTPLVRPTAAALLQNYPNPFNPATTIRYGLPVRSQVTLTVYNTLGQQVSVLQNGEQDPGYHEVTFDGSALSSGVYFCRLQAGSTIAMKKLVLAR